MRRTAKSLKALRKISLAVGVVAFGTTVLVAALSKRKVQVRRHIALQKRTDLAPETVIALASRVGWEPETVPFVESVYVFEEGPNFVRYQVNGRLFGMPWWVRYRKWWDYGTSVIAWESEGASNGVINDGRLAVVKLQNGNIIALQTGYAVNMPFIGQVIERAIRPVLRSAFSVWLDTLSYAESGKD